MEGRSRQNVRVERSSIRRAVALGAVFLNYAVRMMRDKDDLELPMRTFRFSITYLAVLFAALLADHYFLLQLSI